MTCFVVPQKFVRSCTCFLAPSCFRKKAPGSTDKFNIHSTVNGYQYPHSISIQLSVQPLPKRGRTICKNTYDRFYPRMHHILIIYDRISLQYTLPIKLGRTIVVYKAFKMCIFRKINILVIVNTLTKRANRSNWIIFYFILPSGRDIFCLK